MSLIPVGTRIRVVIGSMITVPPIPAGALGFVEKHCEGHWPYTISLDNYQSANVSGQWDCTAMCIEPVPPDEGEPMAKWEDVEKFMPWKSKEGVGTCASEK